MMEIIILTQIFHKNLNFLIKDYEHLDLKEEVN